MKTLFLFMAFLLGSLATITAQDFYLPVSTNSETAKAAYHQAEQLASNINFREANAQLDKALEEDPFFFMAYVLKIFYASGEEKAALIKNAIALDVTTFNRAEHIIRQQLVIWDKDPKAKIAENMKLLVTAYPHTPQAYHWAALHAVYTDKDVDAALTYAEKLVELSPDFAPNYNSIGYMYLEKQQMDKAKAVFEKYISLLPDEANPYDSMADYYKANKEYAKSAEYYEKAASLGMTDASKRAAEVRLLIEKGAP